MAIAKASDFSIYQDEFFGGAYEVIERNLDAFNAASRNCIQLVTERHRGDFQTKSFFKNVSGGLITRRDTTSVADLTPSGLTMDDAKSPKVNRRIGPVSDTLDAFRKLNEDPSLMSLILGKQIGPEMFADMLDTAVLATANALAGVAALEYDGTAATIVSARLIDALTLFGDRSGRIACWVMHSKVFADLTKEQLALAVTNITDVNIATGAPVTMNRPIIVIDSDSLIESGSPDTYITLGLVEGGCILKESEEQVIESQTQLGKENIVAIVQGEYAFTVSVKGFDYTGGANPTDGTLGTSGNWTQVVDSVKACAGVRLITQ